MILQLFLMLMMILSGICTNCFELHQEVVRAILCLALLLEYSQQINKLVTDMGLEEYVMTLC